LVSLDRPSACITYHNNLQLSMFTLHDACHIILCISNFIYIAHGISFLSRLFRSLFINMSCIHHHFIKYFSYFYQCVVMIFVAISTHIILTVIFLVTGLADYSPDFPLPLCFSLHIITRLDLRVIISLTVTFWFYC